MLYFTLSLLLSVSLIFIIKYYPVFKVNTFQAIVFNYFFCVVTGVLFMPNPQSAFGNLGDQTELIGGAVLLGFLFIVTFNLTGITAQKVGVTISMVAAKTSLIIPVLFSLFFLGSSSNFSIMKYAGVSMAIVAIVLSTLKSGTETEQTGAGSKWYALLPLFVFLGNGIADTLANAISVEYLNESNRAIFTILVFLSAAVIGSAFLALRVAMAYDTYEWRSIVGGLVLGVPNFFSLYFMLKALSSLNNNGAFFFPVFNIGMILVATLLALILFREKLSKLNVVGVCLALVSILLIANQEIMDFIR